MVASQESDSVIEAHLVGNEQSHSLNAVIPAIDVIAHKEVVRVGRLASNVKKLTQIVELAMNITANSDWRTHLLHV